MKILLSSLLLIFSMMTYADDDLTLNVNINDPDFEVTLPANPTTGFQWSVVSYDKNLLSLSNSNFERPKTKLIGAGGKMHFTFTLQKGKKYPKSTEIILNYSRSWDPKSATGKKIKVNFTR